MLSAGSKGYAWGGQKARSLARLMVETSAPWPSARRWAFGWGPVEEKEGERHVSPLLIYIFNPLPHELMMILQGLSYLAGREGGTRGGGRQGRPARDDRDEVDGAVGHAWHNRAVGTWRDKSDKDVRCALGVRLQWAKGRRASSINQ